MGFQFNGTQANVTISGGISMTTPTPASTQTVINVETTGNNSDVTLYTVPANKRFILTSVWIMYNNVNSFTVYKPDGTTILASIRTHENQPSSNLSPSTPIWIYAAGEAVKGGANNGAAIGIIGILEDV